MRELVVVVRTRQLEGALVKGKPQRGKCDSKAKKGLRIWKVKQTSSCLSLTWSPTGPCGGRWDAYTSGTCPFLTSPDLEGRTVGIAEKGGSMQFRGDYGSILRREAELVFQSYLAPNILLIFWGLLMGTQ